MASPAGGKPNRASGQTSPLGATLRVRPEDHPAGQAADYARPCRMGTVPPVSLPCYATLMRTVSRFPEPATRAGYLCWTPRQPRKPHKLLSNIALLLSNIAYQSNAIFGHLGSPQAAQASAVPAATGHGPLRHGIREQDTAGPHNAGMARGRLPGPVLFTGTQA